MSIRSILLGIAAGGLLGCYSVPPYVPKVQDLGSSPFGGYIIITMADKNRIAGELLSVDSVNLHVLQEKERKYVVVDVRNTHEFLIYYARPKHYEWTIPLYTLICASHGYYAAATLPINLIVTIAVTVGGNRAFTYHDQVISMSDLKMFSRFPQGLPPGLDLERAWTYPAFLDSSSGN